MSGALKSVMGGGGMLGSLLNIASAFFPPLQLLNSALNMLTSAAGQATKMAADTLSKEHGMPKFAANMVKEAVDNALGAEQRESSADVDEHVKCQCGGEMQSLQQQWADEIVKDVLAQLKAKGKAGSESAESKSGSDSASSASPEQSTEEAMAKMRQEGLESSDEQRQKAKSGGKGGKASAGSWLEAIAQAMGKVLGEKAGKMVELSDKIAKSAGKEGKEAAAENAKATTEMQATSQMFNLMQSGFSNAIKTMGEGLTQMARKGG